MKKSFSFKYKGKKVSLGVRKVSKFSTGLMFKSKNTSPLMFEFKRNVSLRITSLFVFFPFVAVWLDDGNKVLEVRKIKPFTFSIPSKKKFVRLLEVPINENNYKIVKLLVGN